MGLVLAFNAEPGVLLWLVPGVIGTFLLQQGVTRLAGAVIGTLVAGAVLGACANLVGAHPRRPPRLILLLGGFFVLTVGGVGVRGATALLGGDIVTGLQNLSDFALQVPTVALALAAGVIVSDRWLRAHPLPGGLTCATVARVCGARRPCRRGVATGRPCVGRRAGSPVGAPHA